MFLNLFLRLATSRQVEVKPNGIFTFSDEVSNGEIYKFKYTTQSDVEVELYDPKDRLIFSDTTKSAALFTNINEDGKIRVVVKNKTKYPMGFSYKSPDPAKELIGHLGYVKDVDSVGELARLLDKLITDQKAQLERTKIHQSMVSNSRFWARALMFSELILTGIAVYFIHRDFVAMFEKKQTL